MKDKSISEQLIRLAYADLILQHAETHSPEEFVDNLQKDLITPVTIEDLALEETAEDHDNTEGKEESLVTRTSHWQKFKNKFRSNKKFAFLTTFVILFVLPFLFLLFWSNIKYQDKILPGTKYASIVLSSSPDQALAQIKDTTKDYKFTLKFNDSEKTYSSSEVGVSISPEDTLSNAKIKSNQIRFFSRPFALFKTRSIESATSIDQNQLRTFLEAQNYSNKLPEDAKIEFSADKKEFVVLPEVAGRGIDSSSLSNKLEDSAKDLDTSIIDLKIEDVKPRITSVSLNEALSEANSYIKQKITITSPNKNYIPDPTTMKDWVVLTPDLDNSTFKVTFNEAGAKSYVDSIVKKINRKMEKKLYASIDGSEMLLQEGTPGLQVSNTNDVKSKLANIFKAKQGGSITVDAKEEAPTTENIAATGGRWIFADISQFKLYAYEGARLANSFPMASGKSETPTPTGRYSVMSKVRVKTMRGGTPGRPDYYSVPNIEWIAYFKSGGYAIHGVYWHNKFGIENTSHGCMGLSNTNANWVYNFVEVGTPVIIVP